MRGKTMERKKLTTEQARKTIDDFTRRDMDRIAQESLKRRQKNGVQNVDKPSVSEPLKLAETVQ